MKHYGSYGELLSWYGLLPEAVKERVHAAGFRDFMTVTSFGIKSPTEMVFYYMAPIVTSLAWCAHAQ